MTHDRQQLERLIFFSDAVFAIAMTLLVVEIQLPPLPQHVTESTLAQALVDLLPSYIGFLVSFFVVGRFWIAHHRVFGRLDRSNDRLLMLNLVFLLTIAFMPFPTAVISHYVETRVGVGFYCGWLTLAGLTNLAVGRYAAASGLGSPAAAAELQHWARGAWTPIMIGVVGFAAAMVSPLLALVPLCLGSLIVRGVVAGRARLARSKRIAD